MALIEKTEFQSITILADGQIQVRRDRVVMDGEEEIARKPHRWVLEPGQDITTLPTRVQRIANAAWPPEVVEEYRAKKDARDAEVAERIKNVTRT